VLQASINTAGWGDSLIPDPTPASRPAKTPTQDKAALRVSKAMAAGSADAPASVPAGFLLCDGSEVSQATYSALYGVIGSTWGTASAGNFKLPDSRGKTLMGSLTATGAVGPAGVYTVTATFLSLVTITLPASWGGTPTRVGMIVEDPTGLLYEGMIITAPFQQTSVVRGFINSDGLYGNRVNKPGPREKRSIIYFDNDAVLIGPAPATVTFTTASSSTRFYPYIGQSWDNTTLPLGVGNNFTLQQSYEVGAHNHNSQQPGAQGTAGLGPRSGDPNIGGPLTTTNNDLFSYVDPTTSLTVQAPQAILNIPYNIATFQIIKF
jgi:hypothetical protein